MRIRKLLFFMTYLIIIFLSSALISCSNSDEINVKQDIFPVDISDESDSSSDDAHISQYYLPNTEVRHIDSNTNNIGYVLYISLPRNYHQSTKEYPVLYTLDADYSFAIAHNTVEHFVDRNDMQEIIIVGIAYPGASQDMFTYRINRSRDYTPTNTAFGGYGHEAEKVSGGADLFLDFLNIELIPFIDNTYRTIDDDRGIVGHSFGGLIGTYALLTRPELFQRYIIVSPSLWYDDKLCLKLEDDYSRSNKSLYAKAFFCAGWEGKDMTILMHELVSTLERRKYTGLTVQGLTFPNETHNSVFPGALSRGLLYIYE